MAKKCTVTGGTARYEVLEFDIEDLEYRWEPRVARFAQKAAEAGKQVRPCDPLTEASPPAWVTDPAPSDVIPLSKLADRGDLSYGEAIVHYLCDDPDGPQMTTRAAGAALGRTRGTIKTQLDRARAKLDA